MSQAWLITGTSSGLGHELAARLLARGDRVAGIMRSPDRLHDLTAQYGDALWLGDADVTDGDRVRKLVDVAWSDLDRIDVVVSNAGYGLFGAFEELTETDIRRQVDTNIMGSLALLHAAVPKLREQGGGKVIQISSMAGQMAAAGMSMYHLSKWAIEGLMEALHQELAPFNIQTCLVEPGSARTKFGGSSMTIGKPLSVYDNTPAAAIRGRRERSPQSIPGDPQRMVSAIINAVDAPELPRRLLLGSDAYAFITASIRARLQEAEAQKTSAAATDADDYDPTTAH
jgi:NAD(P)-dependent dehydrogenase (short-subunit alcohol dehydrogenase family)